MLIDITSLAGDIECEDILIVGAGAVGLTLGIALARHGLAVTILEAGGERPAVDYKSQNQATQTGRLHRGAHEGRMRALGGTTRLWGGQLVPFDAADFAGDASTDRPRWPIGYDTIKPWFDEAFAFLGVDRAARDSAAVWQRATGRSQAFGDALQIGMNIWLPQADFTQLFADDIAATPNLRIVTGAAVERIVMDETGANVVAVETGIADSRCRFKAPRVILAAGTLEIVRLLLRTRATTPACGFADSPALGQGFIDHLHGIAGTIEVHDAPALRGLFDNIYWQGRKYGVKIRSADHLRLSRVNANCAATLYTPVSVGMMVRDIRALAGRFTSGGGKGAVRTLRDGLAIGRILLPLVWRYLVNRRSTSVFTHGVKLGIEIEQLPTAHSYLTLDPTAPPETASIQLHWNIDGREIDAVAAVAEAVAAEFETQGLGKIVLDPRVVARDPAFLDDCHDAYHQMGGARMGDSASTAVVDHDLRVFGTNNLYVLGAATFPSGSFANPTLTAIAFGMRLADHLRRQNPRSC